MVRLLVEYVKDNHYARFHEASIGTERHFSILLDLKF